MCLSARNRSRRSLSGKQPPLCDVEELIQPPTSPYPPPSPPPQLLLPPACSRGLAWSSADNPDSPLKPKVSGLWAPLGAPNPHTRTHTYKHTHTHNLPLTTGPTVIALLILTFNLRHNLRLIKMNVFAHVTFSCQVSDLPHQKEIN